MLDGKIQIVILTIPDRRQQEVRELVRLFSEHPGFCKPLVFVDDCGLGAARATQQAIQLAHQQAPNTPILFLEDDLQADHEAPEQISRAIFPPRTAIISFCDMREVEEYSPNGLYLRSPLGSDGRGWWGNQALLIHPETAAVLAEADWFAPSIEAAKGIQVHKITYEDDGRNCSDIRLALIVYAQSIRNQYAVSVPSLFLHVGYSSLCFPGRSMGERSTRNWIDKRRHYGIT